MNFNLFKVFPLILPYIEEIGPSIEKVGGILLPILPEIVSLFLGNSLTYAGVTVAAFAKDGTPAKLTLAALVAAFESYLSGEQVQLTISDRLVTITPQGVSQTPPTLTAPLTTG